MKMTMEIFGREIAGYGLFLAIAFIMVIVYLRFQNYYKKLDFDASMIALVCALIGAGLGAKVLYWIVEPESFFILFNSSIELVKRLEYLFSSGLVFLGGFIGGIVGIYIFLKIYREMNRLMVLDLFAVSVTIMHMFGRIGCLMAGCCYGKETSSPFGIIFPEASMAPSGVKLFPVQLLSAGGNLLIFLILLVISRKNKKPGRLFSLYLIIYSLGRFMIEFLRGDQLRGFYYSLSTSQWISIPLFIIGLVVFFKINKRNIGNNQNISK